MVIKPTRQQGQRIKTPKSIQVVFISLILLLLNPFSAVRAAPANQTSSYKDRAQRLLETLTPEERVGQLFLVTFQGTEVGQDSQIYDLIYNHHIGGVILQSENDNFVPHPYTLTEAIQLTRQLQSTEWTATQSIQVDPISGQEFTPAFIPLLIGISQEGDGYPYDQILQGLTPMPSQMALGATWQPELSRQAGAVLASELSALGINLLLGPSLDVLETPHLQGTGDLGVRTFGGDPFWVGEMGRAFIQGVHEGSGGQMAVVGKHFPGHGSSDRLPEEEVAVVRKSLEQLKQIELAPFFAVTGNAPMPAATVDALLASHIQYQGFQGNIRETTRPVSLDHQAFSQLMSLPALATWRDNGGVIISDNLGSRAFRRFLDPTGESFTARFVARDALTAGNDLLFVGKDFISTNDSDSYTTIVRTLNFFALKYREDPPFQKRVNESVLRILTLKYRLYDNLFTRDQVLARLNGHTNLGKSQQMTFEIAQAAATLLNPSLAELADTLPEPPGLNSRIVFITDSRAARQCSQCAEQPVLAKNALEQAIIRLYGPLGGGQVLQRNLESYSYTELLTLLDSSEEIDTTEIENNLRQASWIVFSTLQVNTNNPNSLALSRFLAERPDLFRQKKLIVFAFNAPYYLDATEISKVTAFYGLYSKTPEFVDVAARLLFGEIPAPPGKLPVSVQGAGYDLIRMTAPDPAQLIPLSFDFPQPSVVEAEGTITPEPVALPEFEFGDLIPVRAGVIRDQNGNPVPDDTPVQFILSGGSDPVIQVEKTRAGIARTTFMIDRTGTLEIRVVSEPAKDSMALQIDISPETGMGIGPTATPAPTETPTLEPSPTMTPQPVETPAPTSRNHTDFGDWLLVLLVTTIVGGSVYWLTAMFSVSRWGVRGGLLVLIGGLLTYTYLALGMPGSKELLENAGRWGVLLVTMIGSGLGFGVSLSWQKYQTNNKR